MVLVYRCALLQSANKAEVIETFSCMNWPVVNESSSIFWTIKLAKKYDIKCNVFAICPGKMFITFFKFERIFMNEHCNRTQKIVLCGSGYRIGPPSSLLMSVVKGD